MSESKNITAVSRSARLAARALAALEGRGTEFCLRRGGGGDPADRDVDGENPPRRSHSRRCRSARRILANENGKVTVLSISWGAPSGRPHGPAFERLRVGDAPPATCERHGGAARRALLGAQRRPPRGTRGPASTSTATRAMRPRWRARRRRRRRRPRRRWRARRAAPPACWRAAGGRRRGGCSAPGGRRRRLRRRGRGRRLHRRGLDALLRVGRDHLRVEQSRRLRAGRRVGVRRLLCRR